MDDKAVEIYYINHRGLRGWRKIVPLAIAWGSNEWHPEVQWLLTALDLDKQATRTFAMNDILSWRSS